uniref:PseudoU_synth_2 domain-containing protein n=1 Tax=Haemonchus contortus TaxID=6289 RepID=A0A7I5EEH5_HAECO
MLHRLDEEGSHCGLIANTSEIKVMRNQFSGDTPVLSKGGAIEDVDEYVYLGSHLKMRNDLTGKLARRRKAGWAAFNSIRSVLENRGTANFEQTYLIQRWCLPSATREKPGL